MDIIWPFSYACARILRGSWHYAWSQKSMGMPTSIAAGGQLRPASVALALNADPCVYSSRRRERARGSLIRFVQRVSSRLLYTPTG